MIPLKVKCLNGAQKQIDMSTLKRVAKGVSQIHPGWSSTLTFSEELSAFVELSGAPPDIKGNSEGASNEVDDAYAKHVYGKTRQDVP
ncbi:hypothetical protein [Dyella sp. S184]|uniref:hypothetical protein n=1 Tax=Dyella sp. S184 TaxID=1641862 RepID=UPI00131CFD16|nr:hypothetical protein [Dyella sp. S184]